MNILENISLKPYNSFGVDAKARFFAEISGEKELISLLSDLKPDQKPVLFMGGGSNILFTKDFPGTVIKISTKGMDVLRQDHKHIFIRANAGEDWDDFVKYCVEMGWGGVENLSLIPGKIGTSPVQNIGAYGMELKDAFHELEALNTETLEKKIFSVEDCKFGYRESAFKRGLKGKFIILNVTFRLDRIPVFKLDYQGIKEELESIHQDVPKLEAVRQAVCRIRLSKLPDPAKLGNAGSFFKNPAVPEEQYLLLKEKYPAVVARRQETQYKIPAAWLIEQCGWKGKRIGDAGVHEKQALVLVNYGNAKGSEILSLAGKIQESVFEKFGLQLEPEINIT